MGTRFAKSEERFHKQGAIAAVIGTPLITGPATIATGIILTNELGMMTTAAAGLSALTIVWIMLMIGSVIYRYFGPIGVRVISTMLGLITISSGLRFLKEGLFL
jgi:small neutral amino acid transporter SnatA (MarC family)